jgi:hypothetical protein
VTIDFPPGTASDTIDTSTLPKGATGAAVIVWDAATGTIKEGVSPTINLTISGACNPVIISPLTGSTIGGASTFTVSGCPLSGRFVRLYVGGVTIDFPPGTASDTIDTSALPKGATGAAVIVWDAATGTIKEGASPTINLTISSAAR